VTNVFDKFILCLVAPLANWKLTPEELNVVSVEVDEDVREEYWTTIRNHPEKKNQSSYS